MSSKTAADRYNNSEHGRAVKQHYVDGHPKQRKASQDKYNASENGRATRAAQQIRDRESGAEKSRRLKTRYGITLQQFNELLAAQGGACAICRRVVKRFCVDHCHLTGVVRGITCLNCNRVMGMIADSPRVARAMADYLETRQ